MAESLPDCTTRLLEAKLALHKLMTGAGEVSLTYGDRSVTYTRANADQLRVYIRNLEDECGDNPRRPHGVVFG